MHDYLSDAFGAAAADWLLRLLLAAAILLATGLVRLFLGRLLPALVRRVLHLARRSWEPGVVRALYPPARLLVTVVGLWLAALALEPSPTTRDLLSRVMRSLLAVAIFWGLLRAVRPAVEISWSVSQRRRDTLEPSLMEQTLQRAVEQIAKVLVIIIAAAAIIDIWGFNVTGLVAGLGIGGLAVALAAQDTLANLFGYFVILADQPFNIGEYVVFDGIAGTVESIGFRSTRIRVLDQSLVTVPNNTVMSASVTNWSRLVKRRLNATIGIQYGSEPARVLSVVQAIREMLQTHEKMQPDSVIVQFVDFGENALQIMLICFVNTPVWADFQAARQDINLRILEILREHGVSLAFPSRSLYIEQMPAAGAPLAATRPVHAPKPEPRESTATDSPVPPDAAN